MKTSRKFARRKLQFEPLESREMMAVTASLSSGVLKVYGSDANDSINLKQSSGKISVVGVSGSWSATKVKSILVDLKGGDDIVSLNSLANGGSQALAESISIVAGAGNEKVGLANGQEVNFNGAGNTVSVSETGGVSMNGKTLNMTNSVQTSWVNGVLSVTGTNGNDTLKFLQANNGYLAIQGVAGAWPVSGVTSIVVNMQEGNDLVSFDSMANGGNVTMNIAATVNSGTGNKRVVFSTGNNVDFTGYGHQVKWTTNGVATYDGWVLTFNNPSPDPPAPTPNPPVNTLPASYTTNEDTAVTLTGLSIADVDAASGTMTVALNVGSGKLTATSGGGVTVAGSGSGTITLIGTLANLNTFLSSAAPVFNPAANANGAVTLTMTTSDGVLTDVDTRTITVTPVNDPPVAVNDSFTTNEDTAVSTTVRSNDSDVEGNPLTITKVNGVAIVAGGAAVAVTNGTVSLNAAGTQLTFTPAANYNGSASYTYTISDGQGGTSTATVSGTVTPVDDPPVGTNWFDTNIQDAALRTLGHNLYLDGLIDRSDVISLLRNTEDGGIIDATELTDLRNIVNNTSLVGSQTQLLKLTSYIVNGSVANTNYQGAALGGFGAGSASTQLEKLINKWFLGLDRPTAGGTYLQFAGSLFVNGVTYDDIHQGSVGDCYFVASLAEVAFRTPSTITNMFVVNGDGTYTVKFYNPTGQADYVTVDSYLPTNGAGQLIYSTRGASYTNAGNELWVALAEKAYAQLNEFGWSRGGFIESGQNSYAAISGGYIYAAMNHITGLATTAFTMTGSSNSFSTFVSAFNAGKMIGFATYASPPTSGVVGNHAYAVVGYNATNQTVTLFNPWGTEYGLLTMNWSQIQANFMYFDRTA